MNFLRTVFGIPKNETSVKPPLTKKEVDDAVNDFLKDGNPNPSNKEIAEKLGRTIVEVNDFRRYVPSVLHTYYDSDSDGEEMIGKSTSTQGGRKNNKTISNKNKKKHKKLSRRRSNKKNKKSMKRK
jgi:hypothetical protein